MNKKYYYIVVSNYSEDNSKRQPWYTVKHLKNFILEGENVNICASLKDVPDRKGVVIIKFWSLKDLLKSKFKYSSVFYLMSFPIYNPSDLLKFPIKLIQNRKDIWKILLVSLIPKKIIFSRLNKASGVICISDRSYDLFNKKINKLKIYYPYFYSNWGATKPSNNNLSDKPVIGYFGPPFTSRGIEEVVKLANSITINKMGYELKLIIRTERKELTDKIQYYKKKIQDINSVTIVDGFLSREQLKSELETLDCIILPFSFVFSELPVVVLEAIEMNKIVLTTPNTGVSKLISKFDNCHVYSNDDISNIEKISSSINVIKNHNQAYILKEVIETNFCEIKELLCQK